MNQETAAAAVAETALTDTEKTVLTTVREVLGKPALGLDDDLFDHGGTSLSFVRVLAELHRHFGVMVHAAALGGVATPQNLADQVSRATGALADHKGA